MIIPLFLLFRFGFGVERSEEFLGQWIGGDGEMLKSTYEYTKTAAWAASFKVPVEKNGASVLRYRIRARW